MASRLTGEDSTMKHDRTAVHDISWGRQCWARVDVRAVCMLGCFLLEDDYTLSRQYGWTSTRSPRHSTLCGWIFAWLPSRRRVRHRQRH